MPEIKELIGVTSLITFFLICAWLFYKAIPAWKEVRLAGIGLKKEELAVRKVEAEAVGRLVQVVQAAEESIDELRTVLRVTQRRHEKLEERVAALEERRGAQ